MLTLDECKPGMMVDYHKYKRGPMYDKDSPMVIPVIIREVKITKVEVELYDGSIKYVLPSRLEKMK
jgi:hypothetical protein